ncbi:MAG: DUF4292 domain-containing protein [bacterium]
MKNIRILWILFIVLTVNMFYGCVTSVQELEEQVLPSDRLVKKLEANRRKIKTFEGTGIINVESSKLTAKGNFEIVIKKPDTIKVSIYGPWGIDLAHALLTKQDFIFYDVMNNTAYKGAVSNDIIKNIFKVDLSFDNLIDAFAGSVNLTEKLRLEPTDYKIAEYSYEMIYADSINKVKSVYDINSKTLAINQYSFYKFPASLVLQSVFSDFRTFDDVSLPYKILIENSQMKQKIGIEYRNITVNKEIEEVKINIPSDVEIIEW